MSSFQPVADRRTGRMGRGGASRLGAAALTVVVLALALAGCASGDGEADDGPVRTVAPLDAEGDGGTGEDVAVDDESAPTDGTETDAGAEEATAGLLGLPDTTVGRRLDGLLASVLSGTVTEEQAAEAFHPELSALVSPADFLVQSPQVTAALGPDPVVTNALVDTEFAFGAVVVNLGTGGRFQVGANVEVSPPHRFVTLAIVPFPEMAADDSLADIDAAVAAWSALDGDAELAVVDVGADSDGAVCPSGGTPLAVGSAFKFWVLGAVATAVDDGRVSWDDEITIDDANRSLPSGQLQAEPAGVTLTVADAAVLMMAISDNTATDHLIALVGREAVEAEVAAMGVERPELNRPLFTTRELFQLKLGDPIRLGLVAEGDEQQRRDLLADLVGQPLPELQPGDFTTPTALDVEWFATVGDLCRSILDLDRRSSAHPPVAAALVGGRGLELDPAAWPTVAFKGGSEPGVLSLTFLATGADGRRHVVSAIVNDPERAVDEARVGPILQRTFELLEAPDS